MIGFVLIALIYYWVVVRPNQLERQARSARFREYAKKHQAYEDKGSAAF